MNVLLAGAAGFLGSHLTDRLLRDGHKVKGVDNLSTGSIDNISHLVNVPEFDFIESDIEELDCDFGHIDLIIHMASPASPRCFGEMPFKIASANSLGTFKLLELAKQKTARFVFTSTSEFYGDPQVHPQPETYNGNVDVSTVRGIYDESKRFSEALALAFWRSKNIDVRIARIFNTYGPRMQSDDGRVIPNFITQSLNNKPLSVYGNGSQIRSFCYVSDMITALNKLAFAKDTPAIHLPINLGNPQEITIMNLAQKIIELTCCKSDLVFADLPQGDPKLRRPDIARAAALLSWKPDVDIEDGLRKTIRYHSDCLSNC